MSISGARNIDLKKGVKNLLALLIVLSLIAGYSLSALPRAAAATAGTGNCAITVNTNAGVKVVESGQYCYVAFTATGDNSFTVPAGVTTADLLIIAGGGAGGSSAWGGGGGAGEVVTYSNYSVSSSSATNISVGAGGTSGILDLNDFANNRSQPGSESSVGGSSGVVASGGGAGASFAYYSSVAADAIGGNGGSGGGATEATAGGAGGTKSAFSSGSRTGYGSNGGLAIAGANTSGGGGGGAGATGSPSAYRVAGDGGAGTNQVTAWISALSSSMAASWQTATSGNRIAGGGGGGSSATSRALGGAGGGGNGGAATTGLLDGLAGIANTGSGGGGGTYNGGMGYGGAGGTGLVALRYQWASITSLSVNSGSTTGSTSVTISGTNLTGATAVSFGGSAGTSLSVASSTSLTVTTPAHAAGAVDVAVTLPSGTITLASGYTYVSAGAAKLNACVAAINDPLYTNSEIARLMGYANLAALETAITNGTVGVYIASGPGTFGASASSLTPDLFCGDSNDNTVPALDSDPTTKDYFFGGAGNDTVTNAWLSVFYGGPGNDSATTISENSIFYGGPGTDSVGSTLTGAVFYQEIQPLFSSTTPTFPNTAVGATSAAQTITVTNSGDGVLTFGSSAITKSGTNSADFAVTTDNCSSHVISVSGTCTVLVTFSPSALGTRTATLSFASDVANSPSVVTLSAIAPPSSSSTLSGLVLSSGTLSPTFASGTTSYAASVANTVTSITVTPTKSHASASIQVKVGTGSYTAVTSGSVSGSFAISVGDNDVNVKVVAEDGSSTIYAITLTRAGTGSSVSTLSALAISSGTLSPAFASGTTTYTVSVANNIGSVTVTPTKTQANASIQVKIGSNSYASVTSGSVSSSLSLSVGSNTILILVTAQDFSTRTYTVTVTRAAAASTDSTLSSLTISSGTLSPSFTSGTTSYAASVTNAISSVTVTPTVTDSNATVKVNSVTTSSGAASSALALSEGNNSILVVVTAQDGTSTSTYTIVLVREAAAVVRNNSNSSSSNTPTTPPTPTPSAPLDLAKNPDANKLTWDSSGPVTLTITSSSGKVYEQVVSGGGFVAPKPAPGESIKVTVKETSGGNEVLKTVEYASPPKSVGALRVSGSDGKLLVATWTPKSSVKNYIITITPTVGAPVVIESKDPTLSVQTAPGQSYKFEVIAVGEGNLKAKPIFSSQVQSNGAPVAPVLFITQSSGLNKINNTVSAQIAQVASQIDSGSSVLVTATVRTNAERKKALQTAISAASKLQSVKSGLWVKSNIVVNPKAKTPAKKVSLSFKIVIRPLSQ